MYEEMIVNAMPRAKRTALVHRGKLDPDDAVSIAYFTLVKVAPRFEPARGFTFWTFAEPRIVGALLDAMRANCAVSCSRKQLNSIETFSLNDRDKPLIDRPVKSHEDAVLARVFILRGLQFLKAKSRKNGRTIQIATMMAAGWDSVSIRDHLGVSDNLMGQAKTFIRSNMRLALSRPRIRGI
jgi:hypothetical protein